MNSTKEKIHALCIEAGFRDARFSESEKLSVEADRLNDWLGKGYHADMLWMARSFEKRIDPALVLREVKTVLSLSFLYDTPFEHSQDKYIPKISRYAWGSADYHKVIKKKLERLCIQINELCDGAESIYYVDDGPVMDKAWAVRSGLGWMGKNTNVISKDYGSFFFIANILTTAVLTPDQPVEDLCKDCSLCINSCPTGAIYEEYNLDSNLCISYQTIENRSETISEVDLHGWIFGCDVCQDVCPFNRPATFSSDEHFIPNKLIFGKSYDELLEINEERFNEIFSLTPVKRAKYKGWVRNLRKAKSEIG